jgi:hypothetical protein
MNHFGRGELVVYGFEVFGQQQIISCDLVNRTETQPAFLKRLQNDGQGNLGRSFAGGGTKRNLLLITIGKLRVDAEHSSDSFRELRTERWELINLQCN